MQFLEFLSLLQKTWTIICEFWNFFLFSKNMDNHMQFLEFLSLFQKRGLSYAISGISFSSPKTWTIICISRISLSLKNMDYHMQFLKSISRLQKHGISYVIYEISFSSPKT